MVTQTPIAPGYYNPTLIDGRVELLMRGFEQDFRCRMTTEEAKMLADDLVAVVAQARREGE